MSKTNAEIKARCVNVSTPSKRDAQNRKEKKRSNLSENSDAEPAIVAASRR